MDPPRMQDIVPRFTEKHIEELYPEIPPEQRAEAAENLSQYFHVMAEIYDDLKAEGKLEKLKLRMQYEKRNKNKHASQNGEDGN